MTYQVYLLLGSNLGDRNRYLQSARSGIIRSIGPILKSSSVYETDAWGEDAGGAYLNQAVMVVTEQSPQEILAAIQHIERNAGRERRVKWSPRTLDIDIAFYDGECISTPDLTIPHPGITERNFALVPLAEITADFVHPGVDTTLAALLAASDDHREVSIFTAQ